MRRYRKALWVGAIVLVVGVVVLVGIESRAHRSPLSVGATVDEAWTYLHSPAAWSSRGPFIEVCRVRASAQALDIQSDVRYYLRWPTNRLFATRHVVYRLDTNSTIINIKSDWKWIWPF